MKSAPPSATTAMVAQVRALEPVMRRRGVDRAWLFGSRARGAASPQSDWDLLVEFGRPPSFDDYMALKFSLEESLGARVDLVSRAACKPRFLSAIESELIDVT